MNKRYRYILFTFCCCFLLVLASCGGEEKKSTDDPTAAGEDTTALVDSFLLDTLRGIYVGDFGGKDIRIVLSYVSESHATGYDIVKGLQRNISGKAIYDREFVEMELSEPGDDKDDGVFKFKIDRKTLKMTGTWTPVNPNLAGRSFTLHKMAKYSAEDGVKNAADFAGCFNYVLDSIGEIHFSEDGLCLYSWYPTKDQETYRDQLQEIKGSWTFRKDKVIVNWKDNDVFPSQSVFTYYWPKRGDFESEMPFVETDGRKFEVDIW